MAAGRMAEQIDPSGIAAEAGRIVVDEAGGSDHLIGDDADVAVELINAGEIRDDAMRTGAHEQLGRSAEFARAPRPPGAPMDQERNRRGGAASALEGD